MPEWLEALTIGEVAAFAAFIVAAAVAIRKVWPFVRRIDKDLSALHRLAGLVNDLLGEPARPGVRARMGVMERLQRLDSDVVAIKASSAQAAHNTQPNGGTSSHDILSRKLDGIATRQDGIATRLEQVATDAEQHRAASTAWVSELDKRAAAEGFEVPEWPDNQGETI